MCLILGEPEGHLGHVLLVAIAKAQERRSNHVSTFETTVFASSLSKSCWSKLHSQAQSQRVKKYTHCLWWEDLKNHMASLDTGRSEDLATITPSTTDKEERRGRERN